jgi:hypothetical protein
MNTKRKTKVTGDGHLKKRKLSKTSEREEYYVRGNKADEDSMTPPKKDINQFLKSCALTKKGSLWAANTVLLQRKTKSNQPVTF